MAFENRFDEVVDCVYFGCFRARDEKLGGDLSLILEVNRRRSDG
jgi:hypothetical protein